MTGAHLAEVTLRTNREERLTAAKKGCDHGQCVATAQWPDEVDPHDNPMARRGWHGRCDRQRRPLGDRRPAPAAAAHPRG